MKFLDIHHPYSKERSNYAEKYAEYIYKSFFKKTGKLLDIGCGRGYYIDAFNKLGFETGGCDVEVVREDVIQVNLEKSKLPYEDNTFDFVFSKSVIEHIKNTDNYLSEIKRVLKPDGMLFLMTPNWKTAYKIFYDSFTHYRPFTKRSLKGILLYHDFKNIIVKNARHPPYIWRMFGYKTLGWSWYPFKKSYEIIAIASVKKN